MFRKIFYIPLYNILIWLVTILPGGSVGWAVVILTIAVKTLLAPLNLASIKSQIAQKKLQPKIDALRKEFPDKQEQSVKMMELYKEHKTNPFSGCLLILIQLPIILSLYYVFLRGISVDPSILYKWVSQPEVFNTMFLGIDLGAKSIIFALIAGITQFIQVQLSPSFRNFGNDNKDKDGVIEATVDGKEPDTQDMMANMGTMMQKQMKFIMPIMITVVAMAVPAAVALYWVVNNLVTIVIESIATWQEKKKIQNI